MSAKLYIKNMVCNRCKMVVKYELEQLGLKTLDVELETDPTENEQQIQKRFLELGFELIDDKKSRLIERIKTLVVELVHYSGPPNKNISDYLTAHIPMEYNTSATCFPRSRNDNREILYCPAHRAGKRTAGLRRAFTEPDHGPHGLQQRCLPEHAV